MEALVRVPGALEVRRSAIHGRGLFAARVIPAGTFLGEYEGERRTWHRGSFMGDWTMRVGDELRDGRRRGNDLRFVNHRKVAPNVRVDGFLFYAARDIEAGEELTMDYGPEWD